MELTGKCKEAFEKWYPTRDNNIYENTGRSVIHWFYYDDHAKKYEVPFIEKYGVYVDFFDSKGICISGLPYQLIINDGTIQKFKENFGGFERTEGRNIAIEESNKIYNTNKS